MAPGSTEIIIVIVVILLLFGAAAIPKLARSLGRAQGEFQQARQEFQKGMDQGKQDTEERKKLELTATNLGIVVGNQTDAELKAEIQKKLT